jgi:flagellar hook assembly protein FlgD
VATLRIYDATGRLVRQLAGGMQAAGSHEVAWPASDDGGRRVAPGVYFAVFESAGVRAAEKLVVIE